MISVENDGPLRWYWAARGRLKRDTAFGSVVCMAGATMLVAEGFAFTRWGASRKARRALRRYCVT